MLDTISDQLDDRWPGCVTEPCGDRRTGYHARMRTLGMACMGFFVCCGGAREQPAPCVPAAGPPSFLAGTWHAPVSPSDFSIDLVLEGGAARICGTGTSTFPGTDAGGGPSSVISGTEQVLRFDYSTGAHGDLNVLQQDATHVTIGSQSFVRAAPSAGASR